MTLDEIIFKLDEANNLVANQVFQEKNAELYKEATGPMRYLLWQILKRPGLWGLPLLGAAGGAIAAAGPGIILPYLRRQAGGYTTAQEETFENYINRLPHWVLGGAGLGMLGGTYLWSARRFWDSEKNRFYDPKQIWKNLWYGLPQQKRIDPSSNQNGQQTASSESKSVSTQTTTTENPKTTTSVSPQLLRNKFQQFMTSPIGIGATSAALTLLGKHLISKLWNRQSNQRPYYYPYQYPYPYPYYYPYY